MLAKMLNAFIRKCYLSTLYIWLFSIFTVEIKLKKQTSVEFFIFRFSFNVLK